MGQVVELPNNSYKPITNAAWVRPRLCKLQKGCTQLSAASEKAYQLLVHVTLLSKFSSSQVIISSLRYIPFFFCKIVLSADVRYILIKDHTSPLERQNQIKYKFGCSGRYVTPFPICVRQSRLPFKMDPVTKYRKFFNCPVLLYYKSKCVMGSNFNSSYNKQLKIYLRF